MRFRGKYSILSHVVSIKGVTTDPDKVTQLESLARSTDLPDVKSVLGFVS